MYGKLFYVLSVLTVTFTSSLSSSVSLTSDKGCYENAGTAELTAKYSGKSTVRNVTWHYQTDECSCSLAASSCLVAKYSGNCSGDGVDGGFPIKRIKFHCNNVTKEYKITINDLQLATASGGTKWGVAFTLEDGHISEFVYQILNECGEYFLIHTKRYK